MKKTILTALVICALFSCKKKEAAVTTTTDPLESSWYLRLAETENTGYTYYAYREVVTGNANLGNLGFTTNASEKILYKITKASEGKYRIGITNGFAGQTLIYQLPGVPNYLPFVQSTGADTELFTITKNATGDTYFIKPVTKPDEALCASIIGGVALKANYVTVNAPVPVFQKWKLEK